MYMQDAYPAPAGTEDEENGRTADQQERDLVDKLCKRIKDDKEHFKKPFEQMLKDAEIARLGYDPADWDASKYKANITGRHINQKVAALYAKNPKAIARRRERLDFKVWDETEQSLMLALQVMQQAQAAMMTMPPQVDPFTGQPAPNPIAQSPEVQNAMMLIADYKAGMERRQMVERIGKTLEILFDYFTKEQTPVDFKTSMKHVVRRAATTGVAYVKLGFQREMDEDPQVTQRLADFTTQLRNLQMLMEEAQNEEKEGSTAQREMELAIASLQAQQYVLIREGLVFDFPDSTAVIPDRMCQALTGFIGARWLTVEYMKTPEEVKRDFGVDLGTKCNLYSRDGSVRTAAQLEMQLDSNVERNEQVCVWEHYDRATGVVYLLCDGHDAFLREPGAPDVYVEDFWPVYALTFNEVADPKCLIPPSDVRLMLDAQKEYNRARQGLREHRQASRPRFATAAGALTDEDKDRVRTMKPFDVIEVSTLQPGQKVADLISAFDIPGVDPNLYETAMSMTDIELVVGASEAAFGATAKATATESSIAESSRIAAVDSNVDDLDSFLTRLAKAAGQIMLRELSPQTVTEIAGEGAVWPQVTLDEIAKEVFLEIEAGSSGKPNQAQEIRNWKEMLPFLIQMPNIAPTWLARESLRRLDDRMDLTEAITENVPAIVALNRMAQPSPADPGAAPDAQGDQGANNGPAAPGGPTGSDAPMGNNQQPV